MLTSYKLNFLKCRLQTGVEDRVKNENDFSASLIKQIRSEKSHVIEVKLPLLMSLLFNMKIFFLR